MEEQTVIQSLLSIIFFTYYKTIPPFTVQSVQTECKGKFVHARLDGGDRQATNLHASTIKKEPDRQRITAKVCSIHFKISFGGPLLSIQSFSSANMARTQIKEPLKC